MLLLCYDNFLLFLAHKETLSFLKKTFLLLPLSAFSTFRKLPFILLLDFVMEFLIFTKAS